MERQKQENIKMARERNDYELMRKFRKGDSAHDIDLFMRNYPTSSVYREVKIIDTDDEKIIYKYVRMSYVDENNDCETTPFILYFINGKLSIIKP